MKVSIITAVFNGADSIADTLNSVAQQDYPAIEHIVVDGGSTDSTLARIHENSERVATLISEPDMGVYDAFNKGLRKVSGEVVAFLNSGDTYVSRSVVSRMVRELSHDGMQAVFGDLIIVDLENGHRIIRNYSSSSFTPRRMTMGLMPAHPTLFLLREVYQSVGEYDAGFRIAGDFEFCLRVFARRNTPYRYVREPLVRMPRGGLSNSGWRSKWHITREMQRACAMNGIRTNLARLCLRFPLKLLELI
jgi:glycosyltransferase involved in cell wall biosynthesis